MKKYDLTNCSVIVPVYIDSTERLEHVHFLHFFFEQYFLNYHLLFIEQGISSKIELPYHPNVQIERVKEEGPFSTAIISNIGAGYVANAYFCKYDVDAVLHPKAIFDAFELLKKNSHLSWLLPYNGISFTIQNALRKKILSSFDVDALPFFKKEQINEYSSPDMYLKNDQSTGLIHHFKTSIFKSLGGYNEEFLGWGYEDEEITTRFEKMKQPRYLLENYNAFHLDHPRQIGDPIQVFKNYYRWEVIKNMSSSEIQEYIKSWSRFDEIISLEEQES